NTIYQEYLRFSYKLNLRKDLLIIDRLLDGIDRLLDGIDRLLDGIDRLLRRRVGRGAKVANKKRHAHALCLFLYKLNNSRTSSSLKLESIVSPGWMTWSMSSRFFCCKSYIFSSIVPSVIKRMTCTTFFWP